MLNGFSGKLFPIDLTENEAAVIAHKVDYRVELLVDKAAFIAHNCNSNDCARAVILLLNFGNRNIKPALEPAYQTFHNASFAL
jgi:hypothetical protein